MTLCEHPSGCSNRATCRLAVRNVRSDATVYHHYCTRHFRAEKAVIERSPVFDVVDAASLP